MKKVNMEYIVVKKSKIHGNGVFAKKDIKKGTKIIEYVGNKLTKKESEIIAEKQINKHKKNKNNGAVYLFELNSKYDIDGNVVWNPAKHINHSCDSNCEPHIIKGRIFIIAEKNIKKGEEISYNYGYDLENFKDHKCHCKSKKCLGYIIAEEHMPKVRRILKSA